MRKEVNLPAIVRVTLGSGEVMRVRAWGPGHLQSLAASLRGLGKAGSEDSCSGPGGDVRVPRGDQGSLAPSAPLCHSKDMGPKAPSALLYHTCNRA